jgi:hypothetical protein
MLSDLSWDLWVNGSSPAAGLTRDVFGGGEDKNHEPIMLPLALFFSLERPERWKQNDVLIVPALPRFPTFVSDSSFWPELNLPVMNSLPARRNLES